MSQQLNMNAGVLYQQGVETTSLHDIVDRFIRGMLILPPHQRDFVWDDNKKRRFIGRLKDARRRPVGMLSTYQLDNGQGDIRVFLNDGSQRTRTALEYLKDPLKYGDKKDEAEGFLRSYRMPVQHCLYITHDEALIDFQLLNMGTYLTPYELCKGVFKYMSDKPQWPELIEKLHNIIQDASMRLLRNTRYKPKREEQHKFLRNDYALFHRFLTKDKSTRMYDVSRKEIEYEDVKNKKVTEWKLRIVFESLSPTKVEKELSVFRGLIDRETSLMADIWYDKFGKKEGESLSPTLYRWILHCAIWKRNNLVSHNLWEDFLTKLLRESNGNSQLKTDRNGEIETITLSLSALTKLLKVCRLIGATDFYEYVSVNRSCKKDQKKEGVDQSHKLPFVEYGNGETILEPAGRNRSRGAVPIEGEV